MAVEARLTEQMPFVTTPEQAAIIEAVAKSQRVSKAAVLRACVDKVFGTSNANLPRGGTVEDAVGAGLDALEWS